MSSGVAWIKGTGESFRARTCCHVVRTATWPSASGACLDYRLTNVRAIYGQDTYLGPDCQDGQLEALNAQGLDDTNGEALASYTSFSPTFARGVALDRLVKINGLTRKRATYSTVPMRVVGQAGVTVTDGLNGLGIGEDVEQDQAFAAAKNYDGLGSKTFKIISFAQGRDRAIPLAADVPISFIEAATCDVSNINVTVLPLAR